MKINVKTGFGYYTDSQGHVISKAELPAGDHELVDDLNYIEVDTRAELDAIGVWIDPAEIDKAINEKKIADKIRADAIAVLIASGELPAGYE